MSPQIRPNRRTPAMRRLALAAIGIGFFVLSATTMGADLQTADLSAVATAPVERHATAHPSDPPAINAETTAAFVDGLYRRRLGRLRPNSPGGGRSRG